MRHFDRYWIGFLLGLILPAAFGLWYIDNHNLWYVLQAVSPFRGAGGFTPPLGGWGAVLGKLMLVSVFPDLALMFVFYTTDTWRLSKGVLLGAVPYLMASVALSAQ